MGLLGGVLQLEPRATSEVLRLTLQHQSSGVTISVLDLTVNVTFYLEWKKLSSVSEARGHFRGFFPFCCGMQSALQ